MLWLYGDCIAYVGFVELVDDDTIWLFIVAVGFIKDTSGSSLGVELNETGFSSGQLTWSELPSSIIFTEGCVLYATRYASLPRQRVRPVNEDYGVKITLQMHIA